MPQAIVRETGISRTAVRKWMRLRELQPRNRMAPRPGMPGVLPGVCAVARRWTEGVRRRFQRGTNDFFTTQHEGRGPRPASER